MKKGFLYIALAALLFSTMEIALKGVSGAFRPLQLTFLRFALGGMVLLPLARRSLAARPRLALSDWGFFALAGLVCVAIAMTIYQVAVTRAPASVVAVVFSCNPLFIIPLAAVFLGERVTMRKLLSLGLSVLGIGVIAWPAFSGSRELDALGIILTVASAILFAVYGIMGKARGQRYGSVAMTCLSFLCGSAELLALIGISHIAPISAALGAAGLGSFASVPLFSGLGLANLPAFLYIAIGITGGGYVFWFLGMEHTSAQTGSLVFFIKPALAPLLAWLILGEAIGPTMAVGMALVLSGAALGLPGRLKPPA